MCAIVRRKTAQILKTQIKYYIILYYIILYYIILYYPVVFVDDDDDYSWISIYYTNQIHIIN